jgi:hypothetical protein
VGRVAGASYGRCRRYGRRRGCRVRSDP